MKAVIYTKYGSPEVLKLVELEKPTPESNEVLIKVCATTVTPVDCSFRSANPFIARFFTGLFRPKNRILGTELAGVIEAVGKNVTRFSIGDHVFAAPADGLGAHAQFVTFPENGALCTIPHNMSFDEAAAIPNGALTALPFLRDNGKIHEGQKILIVGASGSVGTAAVQIAKYFGAEVTALCSGRNFDLVKSLGADFVIDYTKKDFSKLNKKYDVVFDTVGKSSFSQSKRALTKKGVYLATVINCATIFSVALTKFGMAKKAIISAKGLRPAQDQVEDMKFLKELVEMGKLVSVIDRSYPLNQIAKAHAYVDKGHKVGNVIITLDHDDIAVID